MATNYEVAVHDGFVTIMEGFNGETKVVSLSTEDWRSLLDGRQAVSSILPVWDATVGDTNAVWFFVEDERTNEVQIVFYKLSVGISLTLFDSMVAFANHALHFSDLRISSKWLDV